MSEKKQGVIFRRVRGRIVPIKVNRKKVRKNSEKAAIVGGSAVAADAARTTTVYSTKNLEIKKKKFTIMPFSFGTEIGDTLYLKKNGKQAGRISYKVDKKGEASIKWLSTKREFRGQGYGKLLSKQAALEMRDSGVKTLFQQVVHPNSLGVGYDRKADSLWKAGKVGEGGLINFKRVTKKYAEQNIRSYRSKRGILTSDIFRETDLSKVKMRRHRAAFQSVGTKRKIAAGLTIAAVGVASSLLNKGGE